MEWITATYLVRWILALVAVLLLMGGMVLLMQRLRLSPPMAGKNTRRIKVLESQTLGPRHRLCLIECDNTEHLVLLGPQGDNILHTTKKSGKK